MLIKSPNRGEELLTDIFFSISRIENAIDHGSWNSPQDQKGRGAPSAVSLLPWYSLAHDMGILCIGA